MIHFFAFHYDMARRTERGTRFLKLLVTPLLKKPARKLKQVTVFFPVILTLYWTKLIILLYTLAYIIIGIVLPLYTLECAS